MCLYAHGHPGTSGQKTQTWKGGDTQRTRTHSLSPVGHGEFCPHRAKGDTGQKLPLTSAPQPTW